MYPLYMDVFEMTTNGTMADFDINEQLLTRAINIYVLFYKVNDYTNEIKYW